MVHGHRTCPWRFTHTNMGFPSVVFEQRVRHSRFIDKDQSFQDFAVAHRVCSWKVIDINQIFYASTSEHTLSLAWVFDIHSRFSARPPLQCPPWWFTHIHPSSPAFTSSHKVSFWRLTDISPSFYASTSEHRVRPGQFTDINQIYASTSKQARPWRLQTLTRVSKPQPPSTESALGGLQTLTRSTPPPQSKPALGGYRHQPEFLSLSLRAQSPPLAVYRH